MPCRPGSFLHELTTFGGRPDSLDSLFQLPDRPWNPGSMLGLGPGEMTARSEKFEHVAASLDAQRLLRGGETETPRDAVLHDIDVGILELHDLPAVDADQVIVMGAAEEVGIVETLPPAQRDLAQHPALHEKRDRPVNGGAGDGMRLAQFGKEVLGTEMVVIAEDQRDKRLPLLRETKSLGRKERLRLTQDGLEGFEVHGR